MPIHSKHRANLQRLALAACLLLCLSGCGKPDAAPQQSAPQSKPRPRAADLSVMVLHDEAMAEALTRLRGEWEERAGAALSVQQTTLDELIGKEAPQADVLIYPPLATGQLYALGWLRPVRKSALEGENFDYGDLLPAARHTMVFDGQTIAVPLGVPPLLRATGLPPEGGATDPTSLAHQLIAHALSLLPKRRGDGLLFDPDTMSARLNSPVMERALSEILEQNQTKAPLLGWPALWGKPPEDAAPVEALQRGTQVYDGVTNKWRSANDSGTIALIGYRGRVASVTSNSRNATSAFRLLEWLASGDAAVQVSSSSRQTLFFRRSQKSLAGRWPGMADWSGAAEAAEASLRVERPLLLPRIAGWEEYAEALGKAVQAAADGDAEPAECLRVAADRWEAITERLGREAQAESYRAHLETDPHDR